MTSASMPDQLKIGEEVHDFVRRHHPDGEDTCWRCKKLEHHPCHTGQVSDSIPEDDDTRGYVLVPPVATSIMSPAAVFSEEEAGKLYAKVLEDARPFLSIADTKGKEKVDGERQEQHGDPVRNMERFAEMLTGYFGHTVTPHDAVMIQLLFKISRSKANPNHADNYDDLEGYTEIGRRVARVTCEQH